MAGYRGPDLPGTAENRPKSVQIRRDKHPLPKIGPNSVGTASLARNLSKFGGDSLPCPKMAGYHGPDLPGTAQNRPKLVQIRWDKLPLPKIDPNSVGTASLAQNWSEFGRDSLPCPKIIQILSKSVQIGDKIDGHDSCRARQLRAISLKALLLCLSLYSDRFGLVYKLNTYTIYIYIYIYIYGSREIQRW